MAASPLLSRSASPEPHPRPLPRAARSTPPPRRPRAPPSWPGLVRPARRPVSHGMKSIARAHRLLSFTCEAELSAESGGLPVFTWPERARRGSGDARRQKCGAGVPDPGRRDGHRAGSWDLPHVPTRGRPLVPLRSPGRTAARFAGINRPEHDPDALAAGTSRTMSGRGHHPPVPHSCPVPVPLSSIGGAMIPPRSFEPAAALASRTRHHYHR